MNESKTVIADASLLQVAANRYGVDPTKMLGVLKGTVIKPHKGREATNEEVQAFLIVANEYDLNPFTREIYAFASNGSIVPIVGVDGWVKIVNRQKNFDGVEFDYESDETTGKPISVTCRIYIKGRSRPVEITEYYAECCKPTAPWADMPRRLLRHKAYIQTARVAFSISGIYDEEEAKAIVEGTVVASTVKHDRITSLSQLTEKLNEVDEVEVAQVDCETPKTFAELTTIVKEFQLELAASTNVLQCRLALEKMSVYFDDVETEVHCQECFDNRIADIQAAH